MASAAVAAEHAQLESVACSAPPSEARPCVQQLNASRSPQGAQHEVSVSLLQQQRWLYLHSLILSLAAHTLYTSSIDLSVGWR